MSIFHWDSDLFRSAMNRSKEIKGEKPHEDDSNFDWDSLDPDEPAAAETLAALDVEFLASAEDAAIIKKALSSAWLRIRALEVSLRDERFHREQLEEGQTNFKYSAEPEEEQVSFTIRGSKG